VNLDNLITAKLLRKRNNIESKYAFEELLTSIEIENSIGQSYLHLSEKKQSKFYWIGLFNFHNLVTLGFEVETTTHIDTFKNLIKGLRISWRELQ